MPRLRQVSVSPLANRLTRVPHADALIEDIKTLCCFVDNALAVSPDIRASDVPESTTSSQQASTDPGSGSDSSLQLLQICT